MAWAIVILYSILPESVIAGKGDICHGLFPPVTRLGSRSGVASFVLMLGLDDGRGTSRWYELAAWESTWDEPGGMDQ